MCCERVVMTLSNELPSCPIQSFIHICEMMLSTNAGEVGQDKVVLLSSEYTARKVLFPDAVNPSLKYGHFTQENK